MIRTVLGSLVALVGAAAAVYSPFRNWYDGRHGSEYRIQDLFNGITATKPGDAGGSVLIPLAFAALITVIGILLRSRLLVTLAGLVTIGFTVLWMVRVGIAQHSLVLSSNGSGLGLGVGYALIGGVLMLLGAGLMRGRRVRAVAPAPQPEPVPGPGPEAWGTGAYPAASAYEPTEVDRPMGQQVGRPVGQPIDQPYEPGAEHDTLSFSSADLPADLTAPEEPGERGSGATRARPSEE
ncbi:hypothetical protein [Streptomyces sp. NBC_01180]|uniref:hypothetical protein n=1 Tax=Streptomyces sp. NBC_01180 TaxID=2903763 RepID=UPI00386C4DBD|nr:hypothetical protein OG708_14915 [Streptomyces sp. NBC_01180]